MNYVRTGMLLAALTALFLAVGFVIGGQAGMLFAFVLALAMNLFAYWNSDRMVLGMYGAHEVDARTAPEFHAMVADLAGRAGLPMPRLFIIDSEQPNAFATGRNPEHAAVAATTGLLRRLAPDEVAGVIAHELGHVKNRDTLTMTITATIAGAIGMLANFAFFFGGSNNRNNPLGLVGTIALMVLAPLAAALVQCAISRSREFAADQAGAEISGRPLWLASALHKIEHAAEAIANEPAERNPATAHMFIINPLHAGMLGGLFSTHPPTEERIARLRDMAGSRAEPALASSASRGPWSRPARRRRGPWG